MPKITDHTKQKLALLKAGATAPRTLPSTVMRVEPLAEPVVTEKEKARKLLDEATAVVEQLDRSDVMVGHARDALGVCEKLYLVEKYAAVITITTSVLEHHKPVSVDTCPRVLPTCRAEEFDLGFLDQPLIFNALEPHEINLDTNATSVKEGSMLRISPGIGVLIGKKCSGFGSMNAVYEGELIDTAKPGENKKVAVKVLKLYPNDVFVQFGKLEIENLHKLKPALAREPTENFPDGQRRNYYPEPFSGIKLAERGLIIETLCSGKSFAQHLQGNTFEESFPLLLQFLHSLAIAEGAGITNVDFKGGYMAVKSELTILPDGVKFMDWNVTHDLDSKDAYKIARAKLKIPHVINQWISVLDAILTGEKIPVSRYNDAEWSTYRTRMCVLPSFDNENKMDTNALIEKINAAATVPNEFKFLVYEAIIECRFTSIRSFYQRMLALYRKEIDKYIIDTKAADFTGAAEEFNGIFEQRKSQWDAERTELKRLADLEREK
ncbi:MAG: hypothetical protein Q7S22_00090 [Candidatus Micrarchaeota archaeon]|nr:hypothetical protein [Candidatus Micrarchaeota archaeon]